MSPHVGPPPGWAGSCYGAQLTPTGWRPWIIIERDVCWLPFTCARQDDAIDEAREAFQQAATI